MVMTKKERLIQIDTMLFMFEEEKKRIKWYQDWRYTRRIAIGHAIIELVSEKSGLNHITKG